MKLSDHPGELTNPPLKKNFEVKVSQQLFSKRGSTCSVKYSFLNNYVSSASSNASLCLLPHKIIELRG